MKSHLYHIQLNIDFGNLGFYRELMTLLGWEVIFEEKEVVGYKSDKSGDLWLVRCDVERTADYDDKGVNHVAIRVGEQGDVDVVVGFLGEKGVKALFGTPKHRQEFAESEGETYYQVMFETYDKILFEVVYVGDKETES